MVPAAVRALFCVALPAFANFDEAEEMTPEVWRFSDGTYVSSNPSALKAFFGENGDGCDVFAQDADIYNMHQDSQLTQICKNTVGCGDDLDGWHLNKDGYDTCVTDKMDQIQWMGLDPDSGSRQVDAQDVTNPTGDAAKITINLAGSTTSENSASLTTTSQISESLTLEVSIPEVMKVSSQSSWLISSTSTQEQSYSHNDQHGNTLEVDVPPGGQKCARLSVDTVSYNSHFEVPVCVTGQMRCQYSDPCNGHYYWYVSIDVCQTVKGRASSISNTNAHSDITDGLCESEESPTTV